MQRVDEGGGFGFVSQPDAVGQVHRLRFAAGIGTQESIADDVFPCCSRIASSPTTTDSAFNLMRDDLPWLREANSMIPTDAAMIGTATAAPTR